MLLGSEALNTMRPYPRLNRDHISQIAVVSLVTCSAVTPRKQTKNNVRHVVCVCLCSCACSGEI